MSSPNIPDTATVDFQDLVGNGRSYKVPADQRDYGWTEEVWKDLWLDLEENRDGDKKRHTMGAVVNITETDRSFLIIDGQQRIATLTALGFAIITCLTAMGQRLEILQLRAEDIASIWLPISVEGQVNSPVAI